MDEQEESFAWLDDRELALLFQIVGFLEDLGNAVKVLDTRVSQLEEVIDELVR